MTVLKRIRKVINWLIFNEYAENDAQVASKLGYTKSSFSQIIKGKVPLSEKFIDKLANADENINKVWIKTGDGSMFFSENTPFVVEEPMNPYCKECSIKLQKIKLLEEANMALQDNLKDKQLIIDLLKGENEKREQSCG